MKIIFLDIDGVLNTRESISKGVHLLPEKVLLVNDLAKETGAKVVVSSAWRVHGYDFLNRALYYVGLKSGVWDVTPRSQYGKTRGDEIKAWLERRPEVIRWVILDDEGVDVVPGHIVLVDREIGITEDNIQRAKEILI